YTGYDLIISEVMLHKAYDPKNFLEMIHTRLNKNGLLMIAYTTGCSPEFSAKENLLGGFRGEDGEIVESETTIERILEKRFDKVGDLEQIPYLIHKCSHHMLLKVASVTMWQIK
ncbi:MAG: hypothetical protein WC155_10170, partial [Candidatus Cloacimonadales bacterium]